MSELTTRGLLAGLVLAAVTALCLTVLLAVNSSASDLIRELRQSRLQTMIDALLPDEARTQRDELACYLVSDQRIGTNMPLYIARREGQTLGYLLLYQSSRGYSNPLVFAAGFDTDLSLHRADVHFSRETPGLGDRIDRRHSSFLDSLARPLEGVRWDVRKFGGDFDYFTGATVTSRAAVLAAHDAMATLRDLDFSRLPSCKEQPHEW